MKSERDYLFGLIAKGNHAHAVGSLRALINNLLKEKANHDRKVAYSRGIGVNSGRWKDADSWPRGIFDQCLSKVDGNKFDVYLIC